MHERTRLFGGAQKQSAYAKVLLEKWSRFLLLHGEEHGEPPDLVARRGPSVALVKAFTTYCYFRCPETAQCRYELLLRHMLAKFVFVWLAYPGWAGVSGYAISHSEGGAVQSGSQGAMGAAEARSTDGPVLRAGAHAQAFREAAVVHSGGLLL